MNSQRFRIPSQIIVGILVIAIGIIFLLDNLGIADAGMVLRYWPMIFIIVGTIKIWNSRTVPGYFVGGAFIFVGLLMVSHRLGLVYFHWRDWWPLFLIIIGITVIVKSLYRRDRSREDQPIQDRSKTMDIMTVMGGHRYKSDVQDFMGGEITSIMGGSEIDLRNASINGDAVINVFIMWGGTEMKIPSDWNVVVECLPILGGVDDKSIGAPGSGKRLIIRGTIIMGGIGIKN